MTGNETDTKTIYALAPVDDILEQAGLPKTRPIVVALSPKNILTRKLGIPHPGEMLEKALDDFDKGMQGGKLPIPKPPGMR